MLSQPVHDMSTLARSFTVMFLLIHGRTHIRFLCRTEHTHILQTLKLRMAKMLSYVYEATSVGYLLLNHKIWPLFTLGNIRKKCLSGNSIFYVKNGVVNVTDGF